MNTLGKQVVKFMIVGITCFLIDLCLLIGLTTYTQMHYFFAAAIGFSVSVVCNYVGSMYFVFERKQDHSLKQEFTYFVLLSLIGLGINQLVMLIGVDGLKLALTPTKITATAIVMVYNFITRKLLLEQKKDGR